MPGLDFTVRRHAPDGFLFYYLNGHSVAGITRASLHTSATRNPNRVMLRLGAALPLSLKQKIWKQEGVTYASVAKAQVVLATIFKEAGIDLPAVRFVDERPAVGSEPWPPDSKPL